MLAFLGEGFVKILSKTMFQSIFMIKLNNVRRKFEFNAKFDQKCSNFLDVDQILVVFHWGKSTIYALLDNFDFGKIRCF